MPLAGGTGAVLLALVSGLALVPGAAGTPGRGSPCPWCGSEPEGACEGKTGVEGAGTGVAPEDPPYVRVCDEKVCDERLCLENVCDDRVCINKVYLEGTLRRYV